MPLLPRNAIYRSLDTNGDGTGTKNAVGDYSVAGLGATEFFFQPEYPAHIERIMISMEDTSGMSASDYGNIAGGLTNGWTLKVFDGEVEVLDFNEGIAVTSNAEIGFTSYDVDVKTWSTGNEILVSRFTFGRAGQALYLPQDHKLSVTFSDDLSGLIQHYFKIQGYYQRN